MPQFLALAVLLVFAACTPAVAADAQDRTVDAANQFGMRLFRENAAAHEGNVVLSPSSIWDSLSLAAAGARGETAAEMDRVLLAANSSAHGSKGDPEIRPLSSFNASNRKGASTSSIWLEKSLAISDSYLEKIEKTGHSLGQVDFANDPTAACESINRWVAIQTEGDIAQIVSRDAVSPDTQFVITNAVNFHGNWAVPFDPQDTLPGVFTTDDGSQIPIPLMQATLRLRVANVGETQMFELPYRDKGAMIVLLPRDKTELDRLQKELQWSTIQKLRDQARSTDCLLFFPRFDLRASSSSVSDNLKALGMKQAFSGAADFSGIADGVGSIGSINQQITMTVDETGSQVKGATAVVHGLRSLPQVIRVDRPFLMMVLDSNNALLVAARVSQPRDIAK